MNQATLYNSVSDDEYKCTVLLSRQMKLQEAEVQKKIVTKIKVQWLLLAILTPKQNRLESQWVGSFIHKLVKYRISRENQS